MGQLEKYGLYVLCLVIFMILGVTIWGGGEVPSGQVPSSPAPSAMRAEPPRVAGNAAGNTAPAPFAADPARTETAKADDILAQMRRELAGGDEPKRPAAPASTNSGNAVPVATSNQASVDAPTKPPTVEAKRTYKVQSGDNFETIARKQLGSASMTAELRALNPGIEPEKLRIGTELVLPPRREPKLDAVVANGADVGKTQPIAKDAVAKDTTAKNSTDKKAAPAVRGVADDRNYIVAKGDTFDRIARVELGSSKRIDELLQLNPNVKPTQLKVGMRLRLPRK
jgi:LysM repeat protein